MRELDLILAPTPEDKEREIDRANAAAMRQLTGGAEMPKPIPLKRRKRSA